MPEELNNKLIETSTRFLTSTDANSPELLDKYGSLNSLLKTVLVTGYNEKTVESLTLDLETSEVIVGLPFNHGFEFNQVVEIRGASEETFNGFFRIVAQETSNIKIINTSEKYLTSASTDTIITIKIAPLGYTIAYENEDEGILCFKNKSLKSPAILKSIDKIPPNGYQEGWSKYARVVIGQHLDKQGNFVNNNKAPFWREHPDSENTGNGVLGAAGIHGFAKWDYAIFTDSSVTIETTLGHGIYPTDWKIIGDDVSFYLMIRSQGKTKNSFNLLGFGNYVPENLEETTNICLQARDGSLSSDSKEGYNYARTRNDFGVLGSEHGGFLFSNIYGKPRLLKDFGKYRCLGNYFSDTSVSRPWESKGIQGVHPSGQYYTSKIFIKDSDLYIRGYHRGVSIAYGLEPTEDTSGESNHIIIKVQTPVANSSTFKEMPLIFALNDWEKM